MPKLFASLFGTIVASIALLAFLFLAAVGFASVCFSGGASPYVPPTREPVSATTPLVPQGGGIDEAPTATPQPSPTATFPPAATAPPAPSATPVPPPPAPPSSAPAPAPAPAQAPATADFTGAWRITDVVTNGAGAGQSFSFDVQLSQSGNAISGGNSGIVINGSVQGRTATAQFSQPSLGHSGSFTWTLSNDGRSGSGSFSSTVPNSGQSTLIRLN